ncbi:MAG: hypothetical protein ABSB19_06430 [Methylomonas sp.]|jgi:EAL domain-containing protein (putative c-di-GMP-specific phosphodiesterase class I)
MPLQQLVEYFNDRLEIEHNNDVRAFVLENDRVHGLFGPIRIGTRLSPIRETMHGSDFIGQYAQLQTSANPSHNIRALETSGVESVINFDRLSRTVHMLNYLPQAHLDKLLVLDVDARHILGVKEDHGAYFEEIIIKCGLQTSHVAINLAINSAYARLYPALLKGLENYQRRGYRLALKFDMESLHKSANELIVRIAPDFVGVSALDLDLSRDGRQLEKLYELNVLTNSVQGRSILFNIEDMQHAYLARQTGFTLLQGDYFDLPTKSMIYKTEPEIGAACKNLVNN